MTTPHDRTVAWINGNFTPLKPVRRDKDTKIGTVFGLVKHIDDPDTFHLQIEYVVNGQFNLFEFIDMMHIDAVWDDPDDPDVMVFAIKKAHEHLYEDLDQVTYLGST